MSLTSLAPEKSIGFYLSPLLNNLIVGNPLILTAGVSFSVESILAIKIYLLFFND